MGVLYKSCAAQGQLVHHGRQDGWEIKMCTACQMMARDCCWHVTAHCLGNVCQTLDDDQWCTCCSVLQHFAKCSLDQGVGVMVDVFPKRIWCPAILYTMSMCTGRRHQLDVLMYMMYMVCMQRQPAGLRLCQMQVLVLKRVHDALSQATRLATPSAGPSAVVCLPCCCLIEGKTIDCAVGHGAGSATADAGRAVYTKAPKCHWLRCGTG
jgi:hypothetical protein